MIRTRWISFLILLALATAGCGASQVNVGAPDLSSSEAQETAAQEPELNLSDTPLQLGNTPQAADMPSTPPPVEKFIELSKKDLAERLQMDMEKITLVKTEETIWPDASLGCPAPGKVYTQGTVPGYQIWLKANGMEHVYHTDWLGQVVLCPELQPDETAPLPENTGPTPQIGVPIK